MFFESFNLKQFREETGLEMDFVQDNHSKSSKGVLRGLHYQYGDHAQAKLVRCIKGKVKDICVDIRPESKTYGQWFSMILDDVDHRQLFIPKGFAHGFLVLEDDSIINYKCDAYYNKSFESGIIYNDPELNIDWGYAADTIMLSEKDKSLPFFKNHL